MRGEGGGWEECITLRRAMVRCAVLCFVSLFLSVCFCVSLLCSPVPVLVPVCLLVLCIAVTFFVCLFVCPSLSAVVNMCCWKLHDFPQWFYVFLLLVAVSSTFRDFKLHLFSKSSRA